MSTITSLQQPVELRAIALEERVLVPRSASLFDVAPALDHALLWFRDGGGTYKIDFRTYEFRPETIVLVSKQQAPVVSFNEGAHCCTVMFPSHYVNHFDPTLRNEVMYCVGEHLTGKQVLNVPARDTFYVESLFRQVRNVSDEWQEPHRQTTLLRLTELMLLYCVKLSDAQASDDRTQALVLSKFTRLLEDNFRTTHQVQFYVDRLQTSYKTLSKYTHSYCRRNPKEVIVERVLLETKRLLANTALSVKEIAFRTGFDEPTNLVKYFRRYTGMTPSDFRKGT